MPNNYRIHVSATVRWLMKFAAALVTGWSAVASAQSAVDTSAANRPKGQALSTITVEGKRITYPARLDGAYQRLAKGWGSYFTREQIDSLNPLDVSSLLMRLPGVRTNNGVEFVRCYHDAHVQVWVDGTRLTNYDRIVAVDVGKNRTVHDNTLGATEVLQRIPPTSIQMIEVYSGSARIPVEFLVDACAVIVIWTK